MLNPLFDGRPANLPQGRSPPGYEAGFIGEASCAAFSNRLLQCLDDTYTPSTAGFSNYHRFVPRRLSTVDPADDFPERMHAKLLLNVARRARCSLPEGTHPITAMALQVLCAHGAGRDLHQSQGDGRQRNSARDQVLREISSYASRTRPLRRAIPNAYRGIDTSGNLAVAPSLKVTQLT